jgi:hypothetical protein
MPYNSNILWAGTEIGLFESTDGGQSWHMADNGFPNVAIFELSIMESKTITVSVISFLDGKTYRSPSRFLDVFPAVATTTYVNDLGDPDAASDFIGTGFSVMQPVGFTNAAIHSAHPYPNATDALYQLKVPIEVARGNAILRYEDIALIETGTAVDYTDPNFFDFVIVEGTTDGINWIPLAPGYDARADNIWAQAYVSGLQAGTIDSQTPGDPSMYVRHEMNLLDTFERGDIIFIRFRLHADPLAVAWGWAIDNISIQPNAIVSTEAGDLPASFELGQNYPNPFNPTTTIPFRLEQPALVSLSIYDTAGRTVRTLLDHQARQAGSHVYTFDASELPSGMYLYRIAVTPINGSRSIVRTQTMTLIK